MFLCPKCRRPLSRTNVARGFAWGCSKCHGRAITLPVLRRLVEGPTLQRLWNRTFEAALPRVLPCPACARTMVQLLLDAPGGGFALDVCRPCAFVWFDPHEFEAMPARPAPPPEPEVPSETRQQRAIDEVKRRSRASQQERPSLGEPLHWPAVFGLPVELAGAEIGCRPWATWAMAAVIAVVSIVVFADPGLLDALAMVPDRVWESGGLPMVTSFFVHASWWHLIGNLYFLVVFGDNVEDFLGRARWLLLIFAATIAGDLLSILGDPRGAMPSVGASGGISGVIAFYALRFPRARLGLFLWYGFVPITFSARAGFLFWIVLQCLLTWQQVNGIGHIGALAHLGGALVGVIAWLLTRDRWPQT